MTFYGIRWKKKKKKTDRKSKGEVTQTTVFLQKTDNRCPKIWFWGLPEERCRQMLKVGQWSRQWIYRTRIKMVKPNSGLLRTNYSEEQNEKKNILQRDT